MLGRIFAAIGVCVMLASPAAGAPDLISKGAPDLISKKLEARVDIAADSDFERATKRRLTLTPSMKMRLDRHVTVEVSGRVEYADDETGLGDPSSYSPIAKPFLDEENLRVQLDEAVLQWRKGRRTHISIGKQTVPWGALDGVRVTDAFNPVDLREGAAIEDRPERIGLWAARARFPLGGVEVDAAIAPDPTVNLIAEPGDAFAPSATRFTGGVRAGELGAPPVLERSERDDYLEDAVVGVRAGADFGDVETHVTVISGPDPDPLFRTTGVGAEQGQLEVQLEHKRRTLIGVDAVKATGSTVARFEAAFIPEQSFNTSEDGVLGETEHARLLVGAGVDWNAPADVFVNAQIAADQVIDAHDDLVRPDLDVITTVRAQRSFHNDATQLRGEVVASLTDGDAMVRLDVKRELTDRVSVNVGADLFYGESEGLFGQFGDSSRIRTALVVTL